MSLLPVDGNPRQRYLRISSSTTLTLALTLSIFAHILISVAVEVSKLDRDVYLAWMCHLGGDSLYLEPIRDLISIYLRS